MSTLRMILDAVHAQSTPNMPANYAETELIAAQDQLIERLRMELAGTIASASIFDKYLHDPNIWDGPMLDVMAKHEMANRVDIVEMAREIHAMTNPLDPDIGVFEG